jgi:Zn-dependent peptidase ImmA (M78 family)
MSIVPERFKAPYIPVEAAWAEADRIRKEFWPSGQVPVEVEEILWQVGLRVEPLHSLKEGGDVDALLRGDLRTVIVDNEEYLDDRMLNRIRFSIAHELGHFVLHAGIYRDISHSSVEDWIDFVDRVPEDQWGFMELHAYEFAGRLLVPVERLKDELKKTAGDAERAGFTAWDESGDAAREYIANSLCRTFGVSSQVIEKRIIREKLWPPA